ncbi:hypothetical protein [Calothrix sp. PCC 6303]|uniref:hypothetical protein n=1 Tax=Calothrix sp. PCC 6303 TaxID=1170562 RepID=UPI0002A027A2|nr:hypothetical protein [Calothrix sp. PCC 6303]AFY99726.1 hypothetical protein Cal6303_0655 [Calothrix sp. PCC 6303]
MDIKLGFGAIPRPQYIFVNREADYCWYMLSEDNRQIFIPEKALTCVITGIDCNKKVETQFGSAYKTDLSVLADKPYVIRSGRESHFSRSLLRSLDALSLEQLQNPLTITVNPGDRTVVFCNIYDPATYRVIRTNTEEIDLQVLENRVIQKVNQVTNLNLVVTDVPEVATPSESHQVMVA